MLSRTSRQADGSGCINLMAACSWRGVLGCDTELECRLTRVVLPLTARYR